MIDSYDYDDVIMIFYSYANLNCHHKICYEEIIVMSVPVYMDSNMELSPSSEAASCAATQEFPNFYGTRRFITVFTRALQWSLS
jgi:hypothetical protein